MTLSRIAVPGTSVEVPVEDGTVVLRLRGLSFEDIGVILSGQGDSLRALWDMHAGAGSRENLFDPDNVLRSVLYEAPLLAAQIIAHGAGEPEALEQAAALPIWVQIEALEKIWRLTFARDDSLKKALAFVDAAYRSLPARSSERQNSPQSGSD